MFTIRPLLLMFLVMLSGFSIQLNKPYQTRWLITKGCSLNVGGSTNVNKFSCVIANYYRPDTLVFYRGTSLSEIKVKGSLRLNVENFDCHNPVMTSDLRKTLKAKQFPDLIVHFISISKYPGDGGEAVRGAVLIELAGVTRRFDIAYTFIRNDNKAFTLIGTRRLNFSDFNIIPPRKIGGMIQTNNELNVQFKLNAKIIE